MAGNNKHLVPHERITYCRSELLAYQHSYKHWKPPEFTLYDSVDVALIKGHQHCTHRGCRAGRCKQRAIPVHANSSRTVLGERGSGVCAGNLTHIPLCNNSKPSINAINTRNIPTRITDRQDFRSLNGSGCKLLRSQYMEYSRQHYAVNHGVHHALLRPLKQELKTHTNNYLKTEA